MSPSKDANLTESEVKGDMDDGEGAQLMKLSIGTPPLDIMLWRILAVPYYGHNVNHAPVAKSRRIQNSTQKSPRHIGSFHVMHQNVTLRMMLGLTLAQLIN